MTFGMYINGNEVMVVDGMDIAWEVWLNIREACDLVGADAMMVDYKTGEVIADNDYEEEEDLEPDYDLECGFDPYCGCYTWDC